MNVEWIVRCTVLAVSIDVIALVGVPRALQQMPDRDSFCGSVRAEYPGLRWTELRSGDRLGEAEALLTCDGGQVQFRANQTFGVDLPWVRDQGGFATTLPSSNLLALRSYPGVTEPLSVEVITVQGPAYYSRDRDLIREYRIWVQRKVPRTVGNPTGRILADVSRMNWEPLTAGRQLAAWDMLWMGPDGRAEVEIIKRGPSPTISEGMAVTDANGQFTGRLRLPEQMYFVIDPEDYEALTVRKVVGDVRRATSREEVDAFFRKHGKFHGSFTQWTQERTERWLETLRADELE